MPLAAWKKLRQVFELANPWWVYRRDDVSLPNGKNGEYHFVHTNGSSMVVPVQPDGKLLLVKQYRYLGNRTSIEFPCGSVKDHSSYDETARNELAEETGYGARTLVAMAEFNPYNGVTDETCRVYLARELYPVEMTRDETEEFELMTCTVREFEEKVRSGEVWDGMTLAAWSAVREKLSS